MGFGERSDPLDGLVDTRFAPRGPANPDMPKRMANTNPGVGEYNIAKGGEDNNQPSWK